MVVEEEEEKHKENEVGAGYKYIKPSPLGFIGLLNHSV